MSRFFIENTRRLSAHFKRLSALTFGDDIDSSSDAVRVSLTRAQGVEKQEVIRLSLAQKKEVAEIANKLEKVLSSDNKINLAALSKIIWDKLRDDSAK